MTLQEALKVNGKARLSSWAAVGYIHFYKSKWNHGVFLNQCGLEYIVSPIDYLSEDWMPYIEPKAEEPCEHEPKPVGNWFIYNDCPTLESFAVLREQLMNPKCKHCGAKIRAEKWEAV